MFKARLEELRVGHLQIPVGKIGHPDEAIDIGQEVGKTVHYEHINTYGLEAAHAIYLDGIRFPPDLRASVCASMGPLTQLIMFHKASCGPEPSKYTKRWIAALKETLRHLPFLSKVLKALYGAQPREAAGIIRGIANLLLLVGSRQARKITLPLNFIYATVSPRAEDFAKLTVDQPETGSIVTVAPIAKRISGKGGIITYCKFFYEYSRDVNIPNSSEAIAKGGPKTVKRSKITWYDVPHADQIIFHCVFGSYADNMGLLEWMCLKKEPYFKGRKHLNLKGLAAKAIVPFVPVIPYIISKPSNANQSLFLREGSQQVASTPTFSGYTDVDASSSIEWLDQAFSTTTISDVNLTAILMGLRELTCAIRNKIKEEGKRIKWGTSDWTRLTETTFAMGEPDPALRPPPRSENFFMCSKDEVMARLERI